MKRQAVRCYRSTSYNEYCLREGHYALHTTVSHPGGAEAWKKNLNEIERSPKRLRRLDPADQQPCGIAILPVSRHLAAPTTQHVPMPPCPAAVPPSSFSFSQACPSCCMSAHHSSLVTVQPLDAPPSSSSSSSTDVPPLSHCSASALHDAPGASQDVLLGLIALYMLTAQPPARPGGPGSATKVATPSPSVAVAEATTSAGDSASIGSLMSSSWTDTTCDATPISSTSSYVSVSHRCLATPMALASCRHKGSIGIPMTVDFTAGAPSSSTMCPYGMGLSEDEDAGEEDDDGSFDESDLISSVGSMSCSTSSSSVMCIPEMGAGAAVPPRRLSSVPSAHSSWCPSSRVWCTRTSTSILPVMTYHTGGGYYGRAGRWDRGEIAQLRRAEGQAPAGKQNMAELYETFFVGNPFVRHLVRRDTIPVLCMQSPVSTERRDALRRTCEASVSLAFPFDASCPNFPNYLVLDALSLVRQFIFAVSTRDAMQLNALCRNASPSAELGGVSSYFVFLITAACLLLACDLNESCDTDVNTALLQKFYTCAATHFCDQHLRARLNRHLRSARVIVCEALAWDIHAGGLRPWLELVVTRMTLKARSCGASLAPDEWASLYFEAEALACRKNFGLRYLFDWKATQLQAAAQCVTAVILRRMDFWPLLSLLEDVVAEVAIALPCSSI